MLNKGGQMKISVITPCRNAEKFLADTINSIILQQGNFEVEYIIVDGASRDRTVEIARQYVEKVKEKKTTLNCTNLTVELISEQDEGMYDALVKGLRIARGDIVAYLNADDFYQPNAFRLVVELFTRLPKANWLTGVPTFYNQQGIIIESDWPVIYDNGFIQKGLYNNKTLPYIQQESVFFRSNLLDVVDFEHLRTFKYAGDAYLWHCFSKHSPLFTVSAVLSGYRIHSENLGRTASDAYRKEMSSFSEDSALEREEYDYLRFLQHTWWNESKLVKEKNNHRFVSWDDRNHCWKTDKLAYGLDYRLPYTKGQLSTRPQKTGRFQKALRRFFSFNA